VKHPATESRGRKGDVGKIAHRREVMQRRRALEIRIVRTISVIA
jgi:hypothetical protein